jgi:type IV pilus assembly protein PilA
MKAGRASAGFTLIELLIVVAIVGILAGLGVPFLLEAKAAANESSAIASLRAINSAEANYAATCASGAYAVNIPGLVAQNYLSPDMGFNPKSGYNFALQAGHDAGAGPTDCAGNATVSAYYATGRPLSSGSGHRGFATNAQASIWQDLSGTPPTEPFTAAGTVSPIQ